jgi:hypothetical protein
MHWKQIVLAAALAATAASAVMLFRSNTAKAFEDVALMGLPCSGSAERLPAPYLVLAKHQHGEMKMLISGGPNRISVAKDAVSEHQIRVGACSAPVPGVAWDMAQCLQCPSTAVAMTQ